MKPRTYAALAAGLGILILPTFCMSEAQGLRKSEIKETLARYGHRNWIVIADSAYPSQSRPGITTVGPIDGGLVWVGTVLNELDQCKHVRPVIYLDRELAFVDEKDAPGITEYRKRLDGLLHNRQKHTLLHEKIIDKLDHAAEKFHVLVLKTGVQLPYTSVFIELECGYWSDAAEKRLRDKMKAAEKP